MPRKKIIDEESDVALAVGLREDEELEVTNKQTIRKNKRAVPKAEPAATLENADDKDFGELIEDDVFEDGTLGSLLNRSEDDELRATQCNIIVVRKPDSVGEKFINPCISRMTFPPIRNVELTQSQSEIEELVRAYYGGGHYYLQIQLGNAMQQGWACDLADSPEAVTRAKQAQFRADNPEIASPTPPPVNAFEDKIAEMELQERYDKLRFGPERERLRQLEDEARRLREENAELKQQNNMSNEMRFLTFAQSTGNQTLIEKALDNLLDRGDEDGGRHWIADLVKTGLEHKDELATLAQMFLGGAGPQPQPGGIENILRQPPPAGALAAPAEPTKSNFKRKNAEPEEIKDESTNDAAGEQAGDKAADE